MVTWKKCEYCNNFKVLYFDQSYIKICSNCIRILDRLNKIKFLENNIERLEKKLRNQIISEHLSSSRLDLLKLKIKCEEKNLKCVNRMFKKQVKIVVKKTDYNKTANNIELIKKLISPKVILFKCDDKYGRKQK